MFFTKKSFISARNIVALLLITPIISACVNDNIFSKRSDINTTTKFSSAEYGVAASKRVTTSSNIPKGGGRSQVGKPYKIAGKWYTPKADPNYDRTGIASWYGPNFHGRKTANGEIFDQYAISAAHPTLPLPSYVRVTNLSNNRSIIVRVNDRGPFSSSRIIDLSKRVADILGVIQKGTARVRVKYVGKAPLEGDDTRVLMASLNKPSRLERGGGANNIRLASAPIVKNPIIANRVVPAQQNRTISQSNYTQTSQGFFIANSSFSSSSPSSSSLGALFYAASQLDNEQSNLLINNAFAAANAMATRSQDLKQWQNANDQQALKINLELGTFANKQNSNKVATAFALLGAVDEAQVSLQGVPAMQLTLTQLKSGVTRKDVIDLANKLGLRDIILYN
ncbi:MAG: septal ring lytic transglycosylase RlpA family protein [Devosiaceae bacterium]|nr:septal ring lytic transglycosylase RlpA family protein [Devosiaceae bacterium]